MNNVGIEKIKAFATEVKLDPEKAKKTKKVSVEWQMQGSQMNATLEFATGKTTVAADMAPALGGAGNAPDPVQYCLFGTASCFAATFATIASEKGIVIRSLRVTAENCVNLSQTLGINDAPIVERVSITIDFKSSGTQEELEQIKSLTSQRCPGMYCLTHPIPVDVSFL